DSEPEPALHHDGVPVDRRPVHRQGARGPRRLLDRDEHLQPRPAAGGAATDPRARGAHAGPGEGSEAPSPAATQEETPTLMPRRPRRGGQESTPRRFWAVRSRVRVVT